MIALAIGVAVMWLVNVLKGNKGSVKGLPSILFMLFICYGLGSLILCLCGK